MCALGGHLPYFTASSSFPTTTQCPLHTYPCAGAKEVTRGRMDMSRPVGGGRRQFLQQDQGSVDKPGCPPGGRLRQESGHFCGDLPTQDLRATQLSLAPSGSIPPLPATHPQKGLLPLCSSLSGQGPCRAVPLWASCGAGQPVQEKMKDPGGGSHGLLHLPAECLWISSAALSRADPCPQWGKKSSKQGTKSDYLWKRDRLCTKEVGGAGVG